MDPDSAAWVDVLSSSEGTERDAAVARLHVMLLRVAHAEAFRRAGTNGIVGRELEDLAHQAADDAVVSILRRVHDFRGESRFTTWAYTFVVLEVASKIGRHAWRRDGLRLDVEAWERLPERLGLGPEAVAEATDLVAAVRRAVERELTPHQRRIFAAIVLEGTPLDALVLELGTNRNAIYKTLFDARRKLRTHLVTNGYLAQRRGGVA